MANKNRWFMPTNTDNLRMIIAQAIISSPIGFSKYYSDALELFPGYIPLFKNKVQLDILNSVVSEVEGLTACILEFDISMIEGIVKTIVGNELIDINLKDIEIDNIDVLLILAPIPISCISKVIFKTNIDKDTFKDESNLYSNVPLIDLNLIYTKADQKLFEVKPDITDYRIDELRNIDLLPITDIDYKKAYAFGGILANLFYFSKNGKMSNQAFSEFSSGKKPSYEYDFQQILEYFFSDNSTSNSNNLYKGIVDVAIERKDFKEGIIEFLESNPKTAKMANKLKTFEAISDKPVSEEFKEAKTLLGKVLLMLFHRENTEALIEYNLDIFTEEDYLVFAVIFGIRDKFIKVPKVLREAGNIQNFISLKMANYIHINIKSKVNFKELKQPITIIDMLKKDRFKEYFAKELNIEHCFQTVIPKSDYHVVKGKPVFRGIVMPKFEVLEESYFQFISSYEITEYNKYLDKYNKVK